MSRRVSRCELENEKTISHYRPKDVIDASSTVHRLPVGRYQARTSFAFSKLAHFLTYTKTCFKMSQRYTVNIAFEEETQKTWSQINTKQGNKKAVPGQTDAFIILLQARQTHEEEADRAMYRKEQGIEEDDHNTYCSLSSQLSKMASRLSLTSTKEVSFRSNSTSASSSLSSLLGSSKFQPS
jgi:hypothetical protein